MKISLNWIKNFIDLTETDVDKIQEIITANTAEIETIERQGEDLDKIVVGEIKELKDHPDADALRIAMTSDGKENIQIVCGGSNLKVGMKVALAKLGAIVSWHGTETVKMKKAKIRGVESFGMICASEEIGLGEIFPKAGEKEILDISNINAPAGTPLKEALGLNDVILDIDNHAITNRSDLFSHRGFAKEFVVNKLGTFKKINEFKIPKSNALAPIKINIQDDEICSRYTGICIKNIQIEESPDWMKNHLNACGVRPINNIVDITNYVMLEQGMPLHAFDLDQIKGKEWTMRKSKKGEKVITLDEQEHELMNDVIILNDGNEIFDLCGIMGGKNSGVNNNTKKIWLHSPVYHPTLVRKAMRGLGQISDASIIYEKGVDTELSPIGLNRAIELILELCPNAKISSEIIDIQNKKPEEREIELELSQVNRLIGKKIEGKEIEKTLEILGFKLVKNEKGYIVSIPSFRLGDVEGEADLIEEIARIHGYDNIKSINPTAGIEPVYINNEREFSKNIKNKLSGFGFNEIYTFAFLGEELMNKTGMKVNENAIEIENPISNDMSLMRQSLLPRTLEAIANNLRYKDSFKIFELNKVYIKTKEDHTEDRLLIIATVNEDFKVLQGIVENFDINVEKVKKDNKSNYMHPGRVAELIIRGQKVGDLYELHPQIAKNFDIKSQVTIAEIDLEKIFGMNIDHHPKYKEIPKFPSIKLDISILISKKNPASDYFKIIEKTDKTLINNIELIDEYTGSKIDNDKRSITFSITYQSSDHTLTDEEVSEIHQKVIENLKNKGVEIR